MWVRMRILLCLFTQGSVCYPICARTAVQRLAAVINLPVGTHIEFYKLPFQLRRSQWPRVLRRGSAVSHFLELWVRIPPSAWMAVSLNVVCCQVDVYASD